MVKYNEGDLLVWGAGLPKAKYLVEGPFMDPKPCSRPLKP